jgi:hypothetical protein
MATRPDTDTRDMQAILATHAQMPLPRAKTPDWPHGHMQP